jgi:hypothetical protein
VSASRPEERARRTYAASLRCGVVLTYEAPTFVPRVGDVVPCRRHGYCTVRSRDQTDGRAHGGERRLRSRRSQEELIAFLIHRPVTTVHVLRRQRFSLRQVVAAEQSGLVQVDLETGRVCLRGPTSRDSARAGRRQLGERAPVATRTRTSTPTTIR